MRWKEWRVDVAAPKHLRGDLGMGLKTKARPQAFAATFGKPYVFEHERFVLGSVPGGQGLQWRSEAPL